MEPGYSPGGKTYFASHGRSGWTFLPNDGVVVSVYTVCVQRAFPARHVLPFVESGREASVHTHAYQVEVELRGDQLDEHGFLVDIDELETYLDAVVAQFRGSILNELPAFEEMTPSVERFAEVFCDHMIDRLDTDHLRTIRVTMWENDRAWAAYETAL